MKIKDFEKFVETQARIPLDNLAYSFIGLGGEVGECLEWFKKTEYRNDMRFDDLHLKKELGDVIHYVTRIAIEKGWTLKEIMQTNVDKLSKRYGL